MNEQFSNKTNHDNQAIAQKLNQVADQTHPSTHFTAKLEEQLRNSYQPKTGWFATFGQVPATLRWIALMVLLALVLSWSIRNLVPPPQPAINSTPTIAAPEGTATSTSEPLNITPTPGTQQGYDFRGAKLYLAQPLPTSPDKAHIYQLKKDEPATREQAQAIADQFGIQGDIYTESLLMYGHPDFVFTDGKQQLDVYSKRYFSYTADMAKSRIYPYGVQPSDHAETTIHEFLKRRGLDFPFSISTSDFPGLYIVKPLAPDSIPMQYESYTPPVMRVGLDENGNVLTIDAALMDYDTAPIGEYGIISAQDALQVVLDDHIVAGKMEYMHSGNESPKEWYRSYPDNQPVTVYGYITLTAALDPGKPALILLDGVPVAGNSSGMESLQNSTQIKATGQYSVESGIRKFNVESWDRKVQESELSGTLNRQGDQIVISDDNGNQYPLLDPPADLPLNTDPAKSQLSVYGPIQDGKVFWTYIQFWENYSHGGGGGGNGVGFYKINLSGSPVPFPSPTAVIESNEQPSFMGPYTVKAGDTLSAIAQTYGTTVDELVRINSLPDTNIYIDQKLNVPMKELPEKPVQDLRGYLTVSIHNKSDGTSSREYQLEVTQDSGGASIFTMEGPSLSELDAYNALPILITGKIDKTGNLVVDSYKIPYPDLHFQIMKGTEKAEQLAGQTVVVFTAQDGKSYVEFLATNNIPNDQSFVGVQGDLIQQEVLILPDESFGGLPVAHVYQRSIIQENGPELQVQANKMQVFTPDNDPNAPVDFAQPNLTIDHVELVYFVSNPYYQVNDPNYNQRSPYIQPAWHFQGHYDDGSIFDVLIQALKQEFLLPELAPNSGVG